MKKKKLKEELNTMRKLNDQYKKQIQKSTKEKNKYDIKYNKMKLKITEI